MIEIRRAVRDNVVTHKDGGLAEFEISEVNEFYEWCISLDASQNAFFMKPYLDEGQLAISQETAFGEECKAMHVAKHVRAPRRNTPTDVVKGALSIFITGLNLESWQPNYIVPILYLYLYFANRLPSNQTWLPSNQNACFSCNLATKIHFSWFLTTTKGGS